MAVNSDITITRCAWLVNPGEMPRRNVRVTAELGKIVEICDVPADEMAHIRPIALLPQFVNAHTHLEFSQRQVPLPPPEPFTDWIRSVIHYRRETIAKPSQIEAAIRRGWAEATNSGSRLMGEITTSDAAHATLRVLPENGSGAVSFREVLGFTADRIAPQISIAQQHLASEVDDVATSVINGLSPHAPYSVHPDLFTATVDLAAEYQCPLAMHLAETQAEVQMITERRGPFVDFLTSLNLWDSKTISAGTTVLTYLEQLSKVPHALAVHGNYLSADEISYLGLHPNIAVVYCPRTHSWFGHKHHPWQRLRDAGATVILGTDSRASNPDLSIWKELQFAAQQSAKPLWELLSMITTTAASAMGATAHDFRITVGNDLAGVAVQCHCDSVEALNNSLLATQESPQRLPTEARP